MHPNHVGVIDFIMQTCTDGIDGLCAEMEQQGTDIAEEARRIAQEEEEKCLEQERKQEELQQLNARIAVLKGETAAQPVIVDDEGEDEPKLVDSASDTKQMQHRPVSCHVY
jgi:uncharacterized protein YpuA (DUF1002 family)